MYTSIYTRLPTFFWFFSTIDLLGTVIKETLARSSMKSMIATEFKQRVSYRCSENELMLLGIKGQASYSVNEVSSPRLCCQV